MDCPTHTHSVIFTPTHTFDHSFIISLHHFRLNDILLKSADTNIRINISICHYVLRYWAQTNHVTYVCVSVWCVRCGLNNGKLLWRWKLEGLAMSGGRFSNLIFATLKLSPELTYRTWTIMHSTQHTHAVAIVLYQTCSSCCFMKSNAFDISYRTFGGRQDETMYCPKSVIQTLLRLPSLLLLLLQGIVQFYVRNCYIFYM